VHIYHLNTWTLRPYATRAINGTGGLFRQGYLVLHVVLIDTGSGLALIDTGWGTQDFLRPTPMVRIFTWLTVGPIREAQLVMRQVEGLGYDPRDVQHIFMTHMHLDHPGGIVDFPWAKVHIFRDEYEAIMRQGSFITRGAYRAEHWAHGPDWVVHDLGEEWHGFQSTPPVAVGEVRFRLVPLPGHSEGMCAVAAELPDGRTLMHCGDSYIYWGQVDVDHPHLPPGGGAFLKVFGRFGLVGGVYAHSDRLRALKREMGGRLIMFCGHSAHEFEQLVQTQHG